MKTIIQQIQIVFLIIIKIQMTLFFARKLVYNSSFIAKMSENLKRAQRVQENIQTNQYTIQNEAKLRKKVTIQSSIDQLEKEMRQQIARSLKNSQSKVIYIIKKAEQKYKQLQKSPKNQKEIQEYNALIKQCEKTRWEFMVHRQACGFTIKNYELVTTIYKIPPLILENQ